MRVGESAPVCVMSVLDLYALMHSTLFAFLFVSLDFFPFLASFHKTISLKSTYFDFFQRFSVMFAVSSCFIASSSGLDASFPRGSSHHLSIFSVRAFSTFLFSDRRVLDKIEDERVLGDFDLAR